MKKQAVPQVHQYGLFEPPLPLEWVDRHELADAPAAVMVAHLVEEQAEAAENDAAPSTPEWERVRALYRQPVEDASEEFMAFYRQYIFWRREVPVGTLLLVQIGDRWEAWGNDAETMGLALGLDLQRRRVVKGGGFVPSARIPVHKLDHYRHLLKMAGHEIETRSYREVSHV